MHKTMKYRNLTFIILTAIILMVVSCKKFNPFENSKPTMEYVSGNEKDKIDLKGSLIKPDMRYVNIYAELVGKTVYVYFNETVEDCLLTRPQSASTWKTNPQANIDSTSPTRRRKPRHGSISRMQNRLTAHPSLSKSYLKSNKSLKFNSI